MYAANSFKLGRFVSDSLKYIGFQSSQPAKTPKRRCRLPLIYAVSMENASPELAFDAFFGAFPGNVSAAASSTAADLCLRAAATREQGPEKIPRQPAKRGRLRSRCRRVFFGDGDSCRVESRPTFGRRSDLRRQQYTMGRRPSFSATSGSRAKSRSRSLKPTKKSGKGLPSCRTA